MSRDGFIEKSFRNAGIFKVQMPLRIKFFCAFPKTHHLATALINNEWQVAERFQANLRRRARASSESAVTGVSPDNSDAAHFALHDVRGGSPIDDVNGPGILTLSQSSSAESHGYAGKGSTVSRARRASESDASEHLSESWSDCGLDEVSVDEGLGQPPRRRG